MVRIVTRLFWWLVSAIVYFSISAAVMFCVGILTMLVFGSLIFPYVNSDTHTFVFTIQIISIVLSFVSCIADPIGLRNR